MRMMLDLAEHQQDGFVALKDIAARQNISKKYLEQIVPILNKSNFLQANRGFQGGYRLVNAPREYTVGSILRLTEGNLTPQRMHYLAAVAGTEQGYCRLSGQYHSAGYSRQL